MSDLLIFLLGFFRVILGIIFGISLAGKLINVSTFRETIKSFHILPNWFISPTIVITLLAEFGVVVMMVVGRDLLLMGFILAIILLAVFTSALISVLIRNIQTTCNCFGSKSHNPVSIYDVIRNIGLMVCGCAGAVIFLKVDSLSGSLSWGEWGFITLIAAGIGLIWINLKDILKFIYN